MSKETNEYSRDQPESDCATDTDNQHSPTYSLVDPETHGSLGPPPEYRNSNNKARFPTHLNIVIQVVGSRGDVQPFIALGTELRKHGHRVRLATHDVFAAFVRESGLEFFPAGGDPAELMAYMVTSPNLIPDMATLREGAIQRKRRMYERMLVGFWDSCVEPDPESQMPFVADAIIANPPSFAHVHCAEALGVPLHLVFTMPWSPTGAFPQPLAGIKSKGKKYGKTNYASYAAVDFLTWQGLGDLVNHWRVNTLELEPVPPTEGPRLLDGLKIPFTYCWSSSLVPKPTDWGNHIDVCGFFFRDPPAYTPPADLEKFLSAGPPPVYIGFGSIVVGDAEGLMAMVLSAVKAAGVRAVISQGWSKLTGETSSDVFYIGDCPHEWLFQRVAAVVHHGGAGTTACGLRYGRPTAIVPFFGDQNFWGTVVNEAGAGPAPLAYEFLTSQKLAQAIKYCLSPEAATAAADIARKMATEDGIRTAVESFYRHLPVTRMTCDFFPDQTAAFAYGHGKKRIKMCRTAAIVLRNYGKVTPKDLRPLNTGNIFIENRRWEPFTAVSAASLSTIANVADAAAGIILRPIEEYRREHPKQSSAAQSQTSAPQSGAVECVAVVPGSVAMLPLPTLSRRSTIASLSRKSPNIIPDEGDTESQKSTSMSATMAAASANSMGKAVVRSTRGVLVDISLAATEGMRAVPELWGEQVKPLAHVEDWRSGMEVAGKTFRQGVYGAMTGIFVRTYEAKRAQGSVGVAKGLGQGTVGLVTKTGSAMMGLVTYPVQGISRSIRGAVRTRTKQRIMDAKWKEGKQLLEEGGLEKGDQAAILEDFEGLKGRKGRRG